MPAAAFSRLPAQGAPAAGSARQRYDPSAVDSRAVPTVRRSHLLLAAGVAAVAVVVLLAMGREPICTCGYVKLWHGVTISSENSQHIADWYTPSHVIHGLLFYGVLWLVARRIPVGVRLALATALEAGWEILENTPLIINR